MKEYTKYIPLWAGDILFVQELEKLGTDYVDQYPQDEEEMIGEICVHSFGVDIKVLKDMLANRKGRRIIFIRDKNSDVRVTDIVYQ